jgi:hypothetical protein
MTNFILSDIGKGNVFFEDGRVTAPFRVAMAEDVFVIGEGEEFGGEHDGGWVVR